MKTYLILIIILLCGISNSSFAQISNYGLIAYYPFNGNANDESGNGKHGVVNGATLANDRFGNPNSAYSFNGINHYIGLNYTYNGFTELTISVWYKITSAVNGLQALVSSNNSGKFVHMQTNTSSSHDNAVYTNFGGPGVILLTQPTATMNAWTNMTMTLKSGDSRVYINGVLIAKSTQAFTTLANAELLRIGSGHLNGRFFNGLIDDIRMYNRAMSFDEVEHLYQTENPTSNYSFMNVKCFLQGYYDNALNMKNVLNNQGITGASATQVDTINVSLYSFSPSNGFKYKYKTILNTNGDALFGFPVTLPIGNYYLVVEHRNCTATFSASTMMPVTGMNYNFSNSSASFIGIKKLIAPGLWAFYSGDINQDQNIDLLDAPLLENDVVNYASGYLATDLNGDGNVDLLDLGMLENNIIEFLQNQ